MDVLSVYKGHKDEKITYLSRKNASIVMDAFTERQQPP